MKLINEMKNARMNLLLLDWSRSYLYRFIENIYLEKMGKDRNTDVHLAILIPMYIP